VKAFVLQGAEVAQRGVASDRVVERFDPLEDRIRELGPGRPVAAVEELDLQAWPSTWTDRSDRCLQEGTRSGVRSPCRDVRAIIRRDSLT